MTPGAPCPDRERLALVPVIGSPADIHGIDDDPPHSRMHRFMFLVL